MATLKANSWAFLISLPFLGCSTSSFHVLNQTNRAVELSASPDRILLECEWLYDADIKGLYGFMIHVLDDKNEVITVSQGSTLGKEDCGRRIDKITRILHDGNNIYIAGYGDLKSSREASEFKHIFPGKGPFLGGRKNLQFIAIANEKDGCYDAYNGDEKPCPEEPFTYWIKNRIAPKTK